MTQALAREPLRVEERRDGWARVVTAYDYPGWMRRRALEDGEGELPPPAGDRPARGGARVPRRAVRVGRPDGGAGSTARASSTWPTARRGGSSRATRGSRRRPASAVAAGEERPGDLVTYGDGERADHVAFWLGDGRILHATARDGLGVVEEPEPRRARPRRRRVRRPVLSAFGVPSE